MMNTNRSAGHMKKILAALLVTLLTYGAGQEAYAAAAQNSPAPKRYDYDGVGAPDAAMVRRVAMTLGRGKTVDVKTTSAKRLRAKIQAIDVDSFTVTHGRTAVPVTIAYDEVVHLKRAGWPIGAKIVLGAGAAVGVGILVFFISVLTGVS